MKSSDSRTPSILIADDQPDVLEALRFLVKGEGYSAEAVTSPAPPSMRWNRATSTPS